MKKLLLPVVSACAMLLVATTASADTKIGVIDVQQIMQKSAQMAAINAQLTKQFKPRQDKIAALQQSLQNESDQLNRNGATMTVDARNALQDKIIADKANLEAMSVSFRRDLATAQNQDLQTFMNKLSAVVNGIAKAGNYDLILQRAGVPFANPSLDITSQALKAMG